MLQKCLSLFACTLFLCHGAVAATGSMRCEVKSNDVIVMKDGSAKKYAGYTDGVEAGDTLILTYQANKDGVSLFLRKPINSNAPSKIGVEILNNTEFGFEAFDIEANEINSEGGIVRSGVNTRIYAYNDSLGFKGLIYQGELERYYKSDWHGFVYSTLGLSVHIMGIACTHNNDNLDNFISTIKAY